MKRYKFLSAALLGEMCIRDSSSPDIAGVGAESIYQFLSQRIALLLQGSQFLIQQFAYLLRYLRGNHSLTYKLRCV